MWLVIWGANHVSMSRLSHNFKLLGETLVSDTGQAQSSVHVQAKS